MCNEDGTDASNELSYLLLEVLAQVEMPQPPIYVRYHNNINPVCWMKAVEVNVRRGDGNPSFVNDGSRILSLTAHGVSLQDARDWAVAGCAGSITPRCSMHGGNLGIVYINLAKIFEYVLNDGRDPKTGKQIGLNTGDPRDFTSVDDFVDAFKKQFDYLVAIFMKMVRIVCFVEVENYRTPFVSALLGDCLKNGMDAREGGVRYTQFLYHISDRGLQNVADSLTAIRKVVFEDQRASLAQVVAALSSDFDGDAALRAMLRSAPKYGNDDDYADDIFGELSVWLQHRIGMEKNPFGSSLWAGRSGAVAHVEFGKRVGALPDGRKAGEPLADGYLSPSQGVDVKGPTAVFNSASKVDHNENSFAALMNMKFDRKVIDSREKLVKLADMVANFFHRGGFHIQINILDRQTLLDAQQRPEVHKNLMVRVAGYSAYYVDLPRGASGRDSGAVRRGAVAAECRRAVVHRAIRPAMTGKILNIQRFSTEDGPGIRTTVFFKGCPLTCVWCSNPESQESEEEIAHRDSLCVGCGDVRRGVPERGDRSMAAVRGPRGEDRQDRNARVAASARERVFTAR